MYRIFDHTADIGIAGCSKSIEGLFSEMAAGLFSLLVDDPGSIRPVSMVQVRINEPDRELLLFDWLSELLYQFDGRGMLLSQFEVSLKADLLIGRASGELVDEVRHSLQHEVKAITYHQLKVWQEQGNWKGQVIVDI